MYAWQETLLIRLPILLGLKKLLHLITTSYRI
jgi:hypothetical protein